MYSPICNTTIVTTVCWLSAFVPTENKPPRLTRLETGELLLHTEYSTVQYSTARTVRSSAERDVRIRITWSANRKNGGEGHYRLPKYLLYDMPTVLPVRFEQNGMNTGMGRDRGVNFQKINAPCFVERNFAEWGVEAAGGEVNFLGKYRARDTESCPVGQISSTCIDRRVRRVFAVEENRHLKRSHDLRGVTL